MGTADKVLKHGTPSHGYFATEAVVKRKLIWKKSGFKLIQHMKLHVCG